MSSPAIDPGIFKAYDIRGIVDRTLTVDAVRAIGAALGSEAVARGMARIAVGRDGRLSGPRLRDALIEGIRSTGTAVVDGQSCRFAVDMPDNDEVVVSVGPIPCE